MANTLTKATVLVAAAMLLVQTVCLASPLSCQCLSPEAELSSSICHCGKSTSNEVSPLACSHCQAGASEPDPPSPTDEGTVDSAAGCHCRLSVPPRQEPVPAPDTTTHDGPALALLDLNAVRPEPVCPVRLSASDVALPDIRLAKFKQVFLCVWLT